MENAELEENWIHATWRGSDLHAKLPRLSFPSIHASSASWPLPNRFQTLVHNRGSNTIDGGLPAIHQPTPSSPRSETFPQVKPPPNPSRLGRRSRARFVCLDSSLLLIGFFFAPCSCYSWQLN